jgi:hypothetical protein
VPKKKTKPKKQPKDFMMPDLSGMKFEDVVKKMLNTPTPKRDKKP